MPPSPGTGRYAAAVQIAMTGSIAMDHLMTFPGRFAESLVVEHLRSYLAAR